MTQASREGWLWLGSFPDGSLRKRFAAEPTGKVVRCRRSLEPAEWLRDLLQEHGGDQYAQKILYTFNCAVSQGVKQFRGRAWGVLANEICMDESKKMLTTTAAITRSIWLRQAFVQRR